MARRGRKLDKETRRLVETTSDIVKRTGNGGKFKFKKGSKKYIKKIKRGCPHWYIDKKGKVTPAVHRYHADSNYWECGICHAVFPINPLPGKEAENILTKAEEIVNQAIFIRVGLGGNKHDIRNFVILKQELPYTKKAVENLQKIVMDKNDASNTNKVQTMDRQFSMYDGYDYY